MNSGILNRFAGISAGMPLAFWTGMKHRLLYRPVFALVFSILSAPMLGANTPVSVDVEDGAGKTYAVDAAFDVNVPAPIAWEVLTDYQGIGRFVSSIRHSTIKEREPGHGELSTIAGGTRVTYRLKADPTGRQPAMLAKSAIRSSVKQLLDEVREEMLTRGAR